MQRRFDREWLVEKTLIKLLFGLVHHDASDALVIELRAARSAHHLEHIGDGEVYVPVARERNSQMRTCPPGDRAAHRPSLPSKNSVPLTTTRRAGKLTPHASVAVQQRTCGRDHQLARGLRWRITRRAWMRSETKSSSTVERSWSFKPA